MKELIVTFANAPGAAKAACCASHGLTVLHWTCAAFLAVMMAYNLVRPIRMAHATPAARPCCSSCKE